MAELARAGLLVDLTGIVDVGGFRATAGDYLASLGTVGDDGAWPTADGRLYGATFAAEVASLVWYPRAAFERAGYSDPPDLGRPDRPGGQDRGRRPNALVPGGRRAARAEGRRR